MAKQYTYNSYESFKPAGFNGYNYLAIREIDFDLNEIYRETEY